jgi:hypothetical protein
MRTKLFYRSSAGLLTFRPEVPIRVRGVNFALAASDSSGGDVVVMATIGNTDPGTAPVINSVIDGIWAACGYAADFQDATGYARICESLNVSGLDIPHPAFANINFRVVAVSGTVATARFFAVLQFEEERGLFDG